MKNVIKYAAVAAMMLVSANTVNAQEVEYGPKAHNFTVEVQFNPFSNNFETFKIDGLSGRYFLTDKDAIRATINIGASSKETNPLGNLTEPHADDYATAVAYNMAKDSYDHQKDAKRTTANVKFGLSAGYERHFAKSGRLDFYAGAQLGFDFDLYKMTVEIPNSYNLDAATGLSQWQTLKGEVSGANYDPTTPGASGNVSTLKIGGGVFTGVDFYVLKNLYIGAELGLNANIKVAGDLEVKADKMDATGAVSTATKNVTVKDNEFNMGFYVVPALRLGWKF